MGFRTQCKTAEKRIRRSKHATAVMKLRLEGLSYEQIGERMGFSAPRAYKICKDELDRLNTIRAETAEQLQRLEVGRLDEMLAGVWAKAKEGNMQAIDRVLAIMVRRAKLLGLDLADKQEQAPGGQLILNVQEVIVNRNEAKNNGDITIEDGAAPSGPARLPPQ